MEDLFKKPDYTFFWKDIKTYLIRSQYNELLHFVVKEYFNNQYKTAILPKFLDSNYALTLARFDDTCRCEDIFDTPTISRTNNPPSKTTDDLRNKELRTTNDYLNSQDNLLIAKRKAKNAFETFSFEKGKIKESEEEEVKNLKIVIEDVAKNEQDWLDSFKSLSITTPAATSAYNDFKKLMDALEKTIQEVKDKKEIADKATFEYKKSVTDAEIAHEEAISKLAIANRNYELNRSIDNEKAKSKAEIDERTTGKEAALKSRSFSTSSSKSCIDIEANYFCTPDFSYIRKRSLENKPINFNIDFSTNGLTVGSVIWLYYYERMGIFKILGALLDDYNYKGKFTISGSRKSNNNNSVEYSTLMDMICTLHRLGISSNLRDRICTYQRVLGVNIDNNLGIESEQNTGFMQSFNKLLDYMLEYYKAKQLAQAIQSQQAGPIQPRSSVATQTSILDTMNLMQQQFEPMQYGRNQINTFLGIATVHATICLVNMLKAEIGIPTQYEKPEEFIPAAYDILIAKRPVTLNETNRFIVHDNCASYGYRLLTDIETANINQLTKIASGATLDVWLNDVEGWVEGYRNAVRSIPEPASAIV
jgi:hypothetical protein